MEVSMAILSEPEEHRDSRSINRRKFLAATTGLAAASILASSNATGAAPAPGVMSPPHPAGPLALEGGTPVRSTMLHSKNPGPQYYDDEERREVLEVLESRSPFRWD